MIKHGVWAHSEVLNNSSNDRLMSRKTTVSLHTPLSHHQDEYGVVGIGFTHH